nr:reverse transcriptase domain-containing protein [Tanacetum cinerariifolium]
MAEDDHHLGMHLTTTLTRKWLQSMIVKLLQQREEKRSQHLKPIPITKEASTGPSIQPEDDTSANIVRDTPSPTNAKTGAKTDKTNNEGYTEILNISKQQGEDVADKVYLEEKTAKIDEGQAGSNPGKTAKSQPLSERVLIEDDQARPDPGQSHVALTGPNPELMHDDFVATMSQPEHVALYEALEASMKRDNRDAFLVQKDKSPWNTSDTKDAPFGSSKQKSDSISEQPIQEIPIPDDVHVSDTEDIDDAHLLKIKPRLDWLKPILDEERPETPEPNWVVLLNDLPKLKNNWANAFATSYKDHEENKLLQKTYQIDLAKLEGHLVVPNMSKPLPLGGPPGQTLGLKNSYRHHGLKVNENTILVQPMVFLIGGLSVRNSTSTDTVPPLIVMQSDLTCGFLVSNIVIRKHIEDLQVGIERYWTKLNLIIPNWDASDFLFKEDYTIVYKQRAIIYRDRNDQKKMIRETGVHKFSEGTMTRILEKLDHMVYNNLSSTSEASTMSQAAIRKLVADRTAAALETPTTTMTEADNSIREIPVAKRGNYKEFISYQPFYFNGIKGVVGLIYWFERTELVFSRSNCAEENKVAFATGTLTNDALSWWNAYAQPIGIEQVNRITWTELKRLLTNKYCPRTEIKKMEDEFYNLSVKGNDLKTYVKRFQELAVLCPNMVPNNEKLMEVFIGGLPRSIKGNVTGSKPHTLEEAINIA